jgi:N-methylhydantoinase B/oxoprolinase/acetone carboxylase alpha subunit
LRQRRVLHGGIVRRDAAPHGPFSAAVSLPLARGDVLRVLTPGGGGFGAET